MDEQSRDFTTSFPVSYGWFARDFLNAHLFNGRTPREITKLCVVLHYVGS